MAHQLADIDWTITDLDDEELTQVIEYSLNDSDWSPVTFKTGDIQHVFAATLLAGTTAAGVNQHVVHDLVADLATDHNALVYWRVRFADAAGEVIEKTNLMIDMNDAPVISAMIASQKGNGNVHISFRISDEESDLCDITQYEFDDNASFTSPTTMTAQVGGGHDDLVDIPATPSGVDRTFIWKARDQLTIPHHGQLYMRIGATDENAGVGSAGIISINYKTKGVGASIGTATGRASMGSPSSKNKGIRAKSRSVRSRSDKGRVRNSF
jgi:hypothetical protein